MNANVIVPPAKPRLTYNDAVAWMSAYGLSYRFALVGQRGYYRDQLGKPGVNDRGIYDDEISLVTPEEDEFKTFNANTDPSIQKPGTAVLIPGKWLYKLGIHGLNKPVDKQYEALVQAAPVTVLRDGQSTPMTGYYGINIHKGSRSSTSSLGCQTIYPDQWPGFINSVKAAMIKYERSKILYLLTVRPNA